MNEINQNSRRDSNFDIRSAENQDLKTPLKANKKRKRKDLIAMKTEIGNLEASDLGIKKVRIHDGA